MATTLIVANAVSAFGAADTYLVINLSGGPNEASYHLDFWWQKRGENVFAVFSR